MVAFSFCRSVRLGFCERRSLGVCENERVLVSSGLEPGRFLIVVGGGGCWLVVRVVVLLRIGEGRCMWDFIWILCLVKDLGKRIRWDCGLVIRSRGRWGKCG